MAWCHSASEVRPVLSCPVEYGTVLPLFHTDSPANLTAPTQASGSQRVDNNKGRELASSPMHHNGQRCTYRLSSICQVYPTLHHRVACTVVRSATRYRPRPFLLSVVISIELNLDPGFQRTGPLAVAVVRGRRQVLSHRQTLICCLCGQQR
jgi:hypothetical protein